MVVNMIVYDDLIKKGCRQSDFIRDIKELEINKIEIRREYIRSSEEFVELNTIGKASGIDYYYSIPDVLFQGKQVNLSSLKKYLIEAQSFGCTKVKLTAGSLETVSAEEVSMFNDLLKTHSIEMLTVENDQVSSRSSSSSAQILKLLMKATEAGMKLKYTYDPGNYVYVEEEAFTNYEQFIPYIGFVHLKDVVKANKETVPVFEGDLPWKKYMKKMRRDLSDKMDYCLEYSLKDDVTEQLKKEVRKFKGE